MDSLFTYFFESGHYLSQKKFVEQKTWYARLSGNLFDFWLLVLLWFDSFKIAERFLRGKNSWPGVVSNQGPHAF